MRKYNEYFNESKNAVRDVHFVSHENMFPPWYTHPSTIRSDDSGTKTYFTKENKYLPKGWAGAYDTKIENGHFIEDIQTEERYLQKSYSPIAVESYQGWNANVQEQGFLQKQSFTKPSSLYLQDLQTQGYEISKSDNFIELKNSSMVLKWNLTDKILTRQNLASDRVIETIRTSYKHNREFNADLINIVETTRIERFENGDEYERVSYRIYSNYGADCDKANTTFRSKATEIESFADQLEIYPNPTNDQITFTVPDSPFKTSMQIMNISGEILIQRQFAVGVNAIKTDVDEFPSGIYIVRCSQGKDYYSSKFVKL